MNNKTKRRIDMIAQKRNAYVQQRENLNKIKRNNLFFALQCWSVVLAMASIIALTAWLVFP
tara:strand:+ start:586 stop:768 length:183 start_codon:yes stop_codon:yes gene_type:complete